MTLDVLLNSPFFTSKYKAIWMENPVVNQMSLRGFLQAPLQLHGADDSIFKSDIIMYSY